MELYLNQQRSIRLQDYDYSQEGAYFITICTQGKECLFGNIVDGEMVLNDAGGMVQKEWGKLINRFSHIKLDKFVVMPNHFHGIVIIKNAPVGVPLVGTQHGLVYKNRQREGRPQGYAPTKKRETIGKIVGTFKSLTTNQYIRGVKSKKYPSFEKRFWQHNYHEHIIRNEESWQTVRDYIINNPEKWEDDVFFVN